MKTDIEVYKKILDNVEEGIYFVDLNRKIVYWNKGAEKITGYSIKEAIDKQCSDNILIHINEKGENLCKSKSCPLSKTIFEKKYYRRKLYLHHKNGHRVPVLVIAFPVVDSAGKITGVVEILKDISHVSAISNELKEFKKLALLDHLTFLWNRRYMEKIIYSKTEEFKRYNIKFGILFIDIDDFKKI